MPDTIPPLDAWPAEAAAELSHAHAHAHAHAQAEAQAPATRHAGGRAGEQFRIAEARRAAFARMGYRLEQPKAKPVRIAGAGVEVHFRDIDNPSYQRQHEGAAGNPKRVPAAWNAKESPLVRLQVRGTIDDRQAVAGHQFRMLFERVQGSLGSPSFIQERVDGGAAADVFTETRARSAKQLRDAAETIGLAAFRVAEAVCGEGISLNELARRHRVRPSTAREALKEALDRLAELWDLGKPRRDG